MANVKIYHYLGLVMKPPYKMLYVFYYSLTYI